MVNGHKKNSTKEINSNPMDSKPDPYHIFSLIGSEFSVDCWSLPARIKY